MKTEKLQWHTVQKRVNDLVPQEVNPRKINDKQMSDLKKSLAKFNLVEIPAIDLDGKILAGHQRIKALQLLGRGEESIDVRVPNRKLTEDEAKRYLIASNALGGDWDFEKLKSFDLDLLIDIGFDQVDLSHFWDKELKVKEEDFDIEAELKKIKTPKTKPGDLIHLGEHRLLCGDSTNPENLKRLFGNDKASMIFSDPVYNIKLDYSKGIGGKNDYGGTVNDNRSYEEYKQFIKSSLLAALPNTKNDCHVFYWCDQTYIGLFQELYRELRIANKRVCLWLKNSQNPTPKIAFNKCYEPAVYGVKGKPYINPDIKNYNEVLNKELGTGNEMFEDIYDSLDIWLTKRISGKDYEHATSKPPKLYEKAIRRCTKPGDIILDSFSGSASTIIAGEQLKRKVYAMELEPVFCDLAIARYRKLTGRKEVVEHV
ncbi:MAG TPA: DNA modification methylase [Candidatus Woesebacteria bacterium]|nr:DNA modification methylase [Candidatus Woesebacteria bacterium]